MYPINWKAKGKRCLVIGGGHVALRKIGVLLEEGALVTVVAPDAAAEIQALAREGQLTWCQRYYRPGEGRPFDLILSASGHKETALAAAEDAREGKCLFNAADFPPLGNCMIPARICRGPLMVTVSTGGLSPAFSREIRCRLEEIIPKFGGEWLERLAVLRQEVKEKIGTAADRERFWRMAFRDDVMDRVRKGDLDGAEEIIRDGIGCFRSES